MTNAVLGTIISAIMYNTALFSHVALAGGGNLRRTRSMKTQEVSRDFRVELRIGNRANKDKVFRHDLQAHSMIRIGETLGQLLDRDRNCCSRRMDPRYVLRYWQEERRAQGDSITLNLKWQIRLDFDRGDFGGADSQSVTRGRETERMRVGEGGRADPKCEMQLSPPLHARPAICRSNFAKHHPLLSPLFLDHVWPYVLTMPTPSGSERKQGFVPPAHLFKSFSYETIFCVLAKSRPSQC